MAFPMCYRDPTMSKFKPINRDTPYLLPPSLQDGLPDEPFALCTPRVGYALVDIVEGLDLNALTGKYQGRGSDAYHPALLLSLLIYGCATTRRKTSADANHHGRVFESAHPAGDLRLGGLSVYRGGPASRPRHDQHLPAALSAAVAGVIRAGAGVGWRAEGVAARQDQPGRHKAQANASKHSALSYGHALKQEDPLRAEPESLGTVDTQLTDAGYFSGSNVGACVQAGIEPLMATGREAHHYSLWAHDGLPEAQACHEHR